MQLELLASLDTDDCRVVARCLIAEYMTVDDAMIGLDERDGGELDYDAEEVYEFHTGERVPACCYAEFCEGDLFLGMFEDCDTDDAESVSEAFDSLRVDAKVIGWDVVWAVYPEILTKA